MKFRTLLAIPLLFAAMTIPALAADVKVDYNHSTNFNTIKTYSWAEVHTSNSIWDARVKDAVNKELAAKGWVQVPTGGDVALVAVRKVSVQQAYDTTYAGFGGRRWGGGMGDSISTVDNYKVGTLIVNIFDAPSRQLIWRATSDTDLAGNPDKNAKNLDSDIDKMFKKFPVKAAS